jgi:hypothetical protein
MSNKVIDFYRLNDIVNGTTWVQSDVDNAAEFTFVDEIGDPVDLSNKSIRIQFRKENKNGAVAVDLSIGDGLSIKSGGDNNILVIEKMIVNWGQGNYFYDIEITDNTSGDVQTQVEGTKRVLNDITK